MAALAQDVFDLAHRATDKGFADMVGLSDMELSSILPPIHQRHQHLIGTTEFARTTERGGLGLNGCHYGLERRSPHARQAFEVLILQGDEFCFSHPPVLALLQEV